MKHVVMMSSGAGSWAAARRVAERFGKKNTVLLFTNVKGRSTSPHAGEDEDNYRFMWEAHANVGAQLVVLNEGRDIYEVFDDEHMLGNSRVAPCSRALKQGPAREWIESEFPDPTDVALYVGIDWTEDHRLAPNQAAWQPYSVGAPLMWEPMLDKVAALEWLTSEGIKPPRLYALGFAHANCGGFCVRMGQAQAAHLLRTFPERYAYHEKKEMSFRLKYGKDAAFLSDRTLARILAHQRLTQDDIEQREVDGKKRWFVKATDQRLTGRVPLTLRSFRLRLEGKPDDFDQTEWGACGCFMDTEVA